MSKGLGQKITIKFTQPLTGDIPGLTPPVGIGTKFYLPEGTATASDQYSSYSPDRAFQDNNSYWYTRVAPVWIQIELAAPTAISGFRWDTQTTGYRPKDFTISGSNDETAWVELHTDTSANESGVKEFRWRPAGAYKYYRWTINTKWSSYIYIYRIELLAAEGNNKAFTITGNQYKHVDGPSFNGPILETEYPVQLVEEHPTEPNAIQLTFSDLNTGRFNNALGNIKVQYDSTKGTLQGRGGPIESFTEEFTPTDLVQKPNPGPAENFKMTAATAVDFIKVEYNNRYAAENFKITAAVTITLTFVGVINP